MSHQRGKPLNGDARRIVFNVIKYFEDEKNTRRYHPYEYAHARAQMATGLGRNTITKIKKEGEQAEQLGVQIKTPSNGKRGFKTRVPLDNYMRTVIRRIIASYYDTQKDLPTLKKILTAARQHLNYKGCQSTLRKHLLNDLGFKFRNCRQNKTVLLERTNIVACRVKYLRRLRANDALGQEKKPVIYLDETSLSNNYTVIHAGSERGFVEGAEHLIHTKKSDPMTCEEFANYVKEKLIPNLPASSIVVLDNAPYHSEETNNGPSIVTTKAEIEDWLSERGIVYDKDWTKAELLQVVKKNKPEKTYAIDNLLAENGHDVLRLPLYNYHLNPIEYVWDVLKQRVAANAAEYGTNFEGLIKDSIASITESDWAKEVNQVKELEQEYWDRDVEREHELEYFIVRAGVESDTEDEAEESTSDEEEDEGEKE